MVERLIMLTKKVDDLLLKQPKIVKVIDEVQENCDICVIQNCPTLLTFKEVLIEYSNTFNTISQRQIIRIVQHILQLEESSESLVEVKSSVAVHSAYKITCEPKTSTICPTSNSVDSSVLTITEMKFEE